MLKNSTVFVMSAINSLLLLEKKMAQTKDGVKERDKPKKPWFPVDMVKENRCFTLEEVFQKAPLLVT